MISEYTWLKYHYSELPVELMSVLLTCIVMSVNNNLLRTNVSWTDPVSSTILYVDWLKLNVATE